MINFMKYIIVPSLWRQEVVNIYSGNKLTKWLFNILVDELTYLTNWRTWLTYGLLIDSWPTDALQNDVVSIVRRENRAAQQQSTLQPMTLPTLTLTPAFWRFPKLIRTLLLFCTCALLAFKLFPSLTNFRPTFTHSHAIIRTHYSPSQTIAFPTRNFQLLINRNFRRSFKPNYSI